MQSLSNHFLIAMPALHDPNFERSVTLICQHDEHGAMGLIINQPLDLNLGELLQEADIPANRLQGGPQPVWYGGPVRMPLLGLGQEDFGILRNILRDGGILD